MPIYTPEDLAALGLAEHGMSAIDPWGGPELPRSWPVATGGGFGRHPSASLADSVGDAIGGFLASPLGPFALGVGVGYLVARLVAR